MRVTFTGDCSGYSNLFKTVEEERGFFYLLLIFMLETLQEKSERREKKFVYLAQATKPTTAALVYFPIYLHTEQYCRLFELSVAKFPNLWTPPQLGSILQY